MPFSGNYRKKSVGISDGVFLCLLVEAVVFVKLAARLWSSKPVLVCTSDKKDMAGLGGSATTVSFFLFFISSLIV